MRTTLLALITLTCTWQAFAQAPSFTEQSFCADRKKNDFIKKLMTDPDNLMAFYNQGGLFNGGVCWWHSRFQRNALYLTIFKPDLAKPNVDEIRDLIKQIRKAKNVVTIPGYKNFYDFTNENGSLIQEELDKWQKSDGILRFAWIDGLSGSAKPSAEKLKIMMDQIYNDVEVNKNIAYNKLQIRGPEAHAWLVVHMAKVQNGYDLEVVDSNFPKESSIFKYREGDRNLNYHNYFDVAPYLEKENELEGIKKVILKRCDPIAYEIQIRKEKEALRLKLEKEHEEREMYE